MSAKKYTIDEIGSKIEEFLEPVLDRLDLEVEYEFLEGETPHPDFENPDIIVKFSGDEVDLLLGNKAELMLALEHLTMEVLRMPSEDHSKLSFDANDYRAMRIEELRMSAAAAAEKVKRTGQPFFFNPMNSRERRVIHLSMREETTLRSESTGTGPHRQVVVYPATMASVPAPPPPPPMRPSAPGGDRGPRGDRGGPPRGDRRGGPPGGGGGRGRDDRPRRGGPPRGPR